MRQPLFIYYLLWAAFFHNIYGHGKHSFLLQFYKTIIGYRLGKISFTANLYVIDLEIF